MFTITGAMGNVGTEVLDDSPGARERRARCADDRLHQEWRSAVRALQMSGPSSLSYRRVDAGGHLDEHGRAEATSSNPVLIQSSIRAVSGGLLGKGKRV
ncbi:hypothetical protein BH93_01995 [Rhodococcoides fascians A25f]|uniref:hypothetical protein n=1 Tax=Rhodococcoides fascians TaxID=1828 RepID=UPI00055E6BEA|nr:hypothetical protein [Rhodococcus fascians]QII04296.1 hypothetical protein BH93_01995 [Rhodococcus fascians A25f]